MAEAVVLLHGFGGTRRAWDGVIECLPRERYSPLALDLPGHGTQAALRPISFEMCVEHVLASAPESFALCGYSMGGRIALHVALAAPERVQRMVLVACSAGIEDSCERERRRRADAALAEQLERDGLEEFTARWQSQPLFAGDPAYVSRLARADQLRNRPDALAAALRGVGAGAMRPLWGRLQLLAMPATVVAGRRDRAYRAIAERMASLLPRGALALVDGGHRLTLESPAALARVLGGVDSQPGR